MAKQATKLSKKKGEKNKIKKTTHTNHHSKASKVFGICIHANILTLKEVYYYHQEITDNVECQQTLALLED